MNILPELLTLNHPIHTVAWVLGWVFIAVVIVAAFYFSLVGAVDVLTDFFAHRRDRKRDRTLWSDLLN